MATSFKRSMHALLHSVPPTLQQATADPRLHQRLLNTEGQVWVSLLWDHCSFLLNPGANRVLVVSCKSLFPQFCVSSDSSMWVNGDLPQEGICHTQVCSTQSPCPCGSPLLTCISIGDAQTQVCLRLSGVPGFWCTQGLFEPSQHLWQAWGLNTETKGTGKENFCYVFI